MLGNLESLTMSRINDSVISWGMGIGKTDSRKTTRKSSLPLTLMGMWGERIGMGLERTMYLWWGVP